MDILQPGVSILLKNDKDEILCVSRKDNHNLFSLIGGKFEEGKDKCTEDTAIRETKEETGLDIYDIELIHHELLYELTGREEFTYTAKYKGEINYDEPHVVKWSDDYDILINGAFGEYNKKILEIVGLPRKVFYKTN